ncbi:catalase [Mobilicoccus caccae]|uniref:Catalase n=1 Tax=Mobilicoccus caccae TaxID=1859295 RepID=A0ABQ6IVQ1_9MICO|nr:catalase [Mobilicoccus caccae]GMA42024.1 catalase [Mobilicoccus caccae]
MPNPDQRAPETVTATGCPFGASAVAPRSQQGEFLTTATGTRLRDSDHSLKAGRRGPTLLQDHHLREKIMHFDHERIPERVVHARGAGAHGVFTSYGTGAKITTARFLAEKIETPVFVRFSTVLGSRGSADTVRDTRGFATKFYTEEGNYDLVGNNIPVFFIQDGIKFPDVVHAAKPHPDREIPQAQSAHDTFWDFVSLHTEAQAHTMWNMSDRGIPASFRTMEGFGVHTFRLTNADGETCLVKFHWKPVAGVHSMTWEEAQLAAGADPDFHRRDLADAIEAGAFPSWELGVQVMPDTQDEMFEGIDLLDPTKLVPEELCPVQLLGKMTLNANPTNYFAETEQVMFNPGHLVPGIDVTNDPLLQARLFSYVDTQLTRLGGPNFAQIPINRAHAPVNDMLRDGFHQHAVHTGQAPYRPNSIDAGNPAETPEAQRPFVEVSTPVSGEKVRAVPATFDDHLSQVRMFYRSLTPVEQDHVAAAYTFELGKCYENPVRERQLAHLAAVDTDLAKTVATGLGLPVPEPSTKVADVEPSPALSQVKAEMNFPVDGRIVGIVADDDADLAQVKKASAAVEKAGMTPFVVAAHGGHLGGKKDVVIDRTLLTTRSIEFDALLAVSAIAPAPDSAAAFDAKAGDPSGVPNSAVDPRLTLLIGEMYRHCKAIAFLPEAEAAMAAAGIEAGTPGIVQEKDADKAVGTLVDLLGAHRAWDRFPRSSADPRAGRDVVTRAGAMSHRPSSCLPGQDCSSSRPSDSRRPERASTSPPDGVSWVASASRLSTY